MPGVITQFSRFIGTDFAILETIYQPNRKTVEDITGWSLLFAFHAVGEAIDLVTKTTGSGIVISNPVAGQATITVLAADTATLAPGTYQFRIERTDAGLDGVVTDGILSLLAK